MSRNTQNQRIGSKIVFESLSHNIHPENSGQTVDSANMPPQPTSHLPHRQTVRGTSQDGDLKVKIGKAEQDLQATQNHTIAKNPESEHLDRATITGTVDAPQAPEYCKQNVSPKGKKRKERELDMRRRKTARPCEPARTDCRYTLEKKNETESRP